MIRILTLADEAYAMPLAVMGRSLLENLGKNQSLLLKIIDGGMTLATRQRVERSWQGASGGSVNWEWVQPIFGKARNLPVWGRIPAVTYARLCLDGYFENSRDRVILLDSDTLILADIAELHNTDLEGNVMAACVDPFIPTISSVDGLPSFARPGLPPDTPYFNAGIMLADLERWREERVGERSLEYTEREHRHLRQYDQDALNVVLAGRWKQLDRSWHAQPRTQNALGIPLPAEPRIVHFSGRLKPWMYHGRTLVDRLFVDYLKRTEWKDFRPPISWKARAWNLYDSPLRRILYKLERSAHVLKRSFR